MSRLAPRAGEQIARDRPVRFRFDGRAVAAYEGDTIASALYAAGVRTFSRSFKYHRRRGLLCGTGACANCLVAVDGAPGVRACTEPVRPGMRVTHLNAWPSLERDVMALADRLPAPALPVGFYYKTFIRPRRMWPVYERVLRHAAGLGRLSPEPTPRTHTGEYRRRHADVLVVGGGAAGLAAAAAAARLGADVVLADSDVRLGGRLLDEGGHDTAAALAAEAREAGVELLAGAAVLGFYDGLCPVWQDGTLHQVRAAQHVFATGTIEQPLLFAGNDMPGVMLSGGARRLVARHGVPPGRVAVVATVGERGLRAAQALREAGVQLAAVADRREGTEVRAARGRDGVREVTLAGPGAQAERTVVADLLVVSGPEAPALSLLSQAGARTAYDPGRGTFAIDSLPGAVWAAGSVCGAGDAAASGRVAGLAAAHALGLGDHASRAEEAALAVELAGDGEPATAVPPARPGGGRVFVCPCEDVSASDLRQTVREGFDSIELAKRYSTVTMGPCQGRMCELASARLVAELGGAAIAGTTARPPWCSVPLGALAGPGGASSTPAKRSALHGRHRALGATVRWAGSWRRAYDYGDADGEAGHVGEHVGVIDVSSLGKLLVRGPDAGDLLDRLYPQPMSTLAVGRVRYGVLSGETGRVLDDGTVCRLDEECFYVTTTSSGAEAMDQWFAWWRTEWGLRASVTDVSQAVSAVNVAGPGARELVTLASEDDWSAEGFPYLHARAAHVAAVSCLALRLGFTGGLGYELHFPAAHAEHVWDSLLGLGRDLRARPFGLEAQRRLRLEKLHLIVGQDTDADSGLHGAGLGWAIKPDREADFVGRAALANGHVDDPDEPRLVGLALRGEEVPREGAVVLGPGDRPIGVVTSAARGPRLGRPVGMAWVPAAVAQDGVSVTISEGGRRFAADVHTRPLFDPEGSALRS